ncbi:MAG: nucleotidyltransferase domain-containing protein [Vicinamibacterales bacterium]
MRSGDFEGAARRHGILLLLQFGSTVTGATHPGSDLDIGVLVEHVPDSFETLSDLVTDVQALFPGQDVDVAILNHADPLFLRRVMDEARLLFGAPRRFAELRLLAFKRYQDYRPYLAFEREYVARHVTPQAS